MTARKPLPSYRTGPGRVRTPTVIQMEGTECGAACLGMILGYFGRTVPLEQLRLACGVSRDGSRASNIVKAARSFCLVAKGFKKETSSLREMRVPLIVFWNFNHFVVLEGFRRNKVYLNDPAIGRRTVDLDEFDQSFTGVVLTFEKASDFRPGGSLPSVSAMLISRLRGGWDGLSYIVLATLLLAIPGIVIPVFSKVFIDKILIGGMGEWLVPLLMAMTVALIITGSLTFLQQYGLLRLQRFLSLTSSTKFFWHVLRLPMQFFAQRFPADIAARVAINDELATLLSGRIATGCAGLLLLLFYAPLLFRYDPFLTWIGIGIAALNLCALQIVGRRRREASSGYLQEQGKLMSISVSGLQLIETLKATGTENEFFGRWAGYQAKVSNAQMALSRPGLFLQVLPNLLAGCITAAILGFGGMRVMGGIMTMGSLIAFQILMASFLLPVSDLLNTGADIQEAEGDLRRLQDVLVYPESEHSTLPVADGALLQGAIELRNITFGYSRLEPPLIENLNLRIEPGQRIALVGLSGSGKSTVCRLVAGLFEPWSGEILLDGKPRNSIPSAIVSESIGFVDQDIALFGGSIADNIALWDETKDTPAILRAAKDACIHEDILAREGGYDAPVDEDARNFSGGQRLRLEIARALSGDPRILILDEATSSLDPQTEKKIDLNLRRRGCTCLISAHRLSTIRDSDELIVLERGQIVERGTHDELLELQGTYARLIKTD